MDLGGVMPVYWTNNDEGDGVQRYRPPMHGGHYDFDEVALAAIKEIRRGATTAQQELGDVQKQCGKAGDREGARYLKDEIKAFHRQQKAAQLWIDWFEKMTDLRFTNWPIELAVELDYVANAYDLAMYRN